MIKNRWAALIASVAIGSSATMLAAQEKHELHGEHELSNRSTKLADGHEADTHAEDSDHEEEGGVRLDRRQLESADIEVSTLTPKLLPNVIAAPGEIQRNAYGVSRVSSRVEAQVVERHARLGDVVKKGTHLVTLTSLSVADAQGELLVAASEWQRVSKLGRKVVAERRFVETETAFQRARAKLLAFGLSPSQVERIAKGDATAGGDGRFSLFAPQAGRVLRDSFVIGQSVAAGEELFEIGDDETLWVDARVNPADAGKVETGAAARVLVGESWYEARVIHIAPAVDESTRTLGVRLQLPRPSASALPGQFVDVRIDARGAPVSSLLVPAEAVLRSADGDWQVFVEEESGRFEAREVELVRERDGFAVIQGLAAGTRVVTRGAFFVQSELAKSGFDVHNH